MSPVLPDKDQIKELIQFLPRLYRDGFEPVKKWGGGVKRDGVITMPWPEYEEDVEDFFHTLSQECWEESHYNPQEAAKMLASPRAIESASLGEIKTMLTFCVRGERFCDGHMDAMIKEGKIESILKRLNEISNTNA